MNIYDKHGRAIEIGDVLKVFHFVGARRKRHYMYKQVVGERKIGEDGVGYFIVSHLILTPKEERGGYTLPVDGKHLVDYEIVQSVDAKFEDRPRHKPENA